MDDKREHLCGLQGFGALEDVCPACAPVPAPPVAERVGVCIHGSLRRSCETCDLADERDALKLALQDAERLLNETFSAIADLRQSLDVSVGVLSKDAKLGGYVSGKHDGVLSSLGRLDITLGWNGRVADWRSMLKAFRAFLSKREGK